MRHPKQTTQNTPLRLTQRFSLSQKAEVHFQASILNADGSVARLFPRRKNLILDTGLDKIATQPWSNCFRYCAVGTGSTPTQRASGVITFTQSTTALVASASFFQAGDVGRLFKFGTGTAGSEMYITAFTDDQNVTVSLSQTIGSPTVGTIWYVNQTGLTTETARTGTVQLNGGDNQSTVSSPTITHKRTFLFPAVGGTVTYNEIGWSENSGAGANLFGRAVFTPGVTLVLGQQLRVVVTLAVTYGPSAPTAVGNVGTLLDTSGNLMLEVLTCDQGGYDSTAKVQSNGVSNSPEGLDVPASHEAMAITATYSQNGAPATPLGPTLTALAGIAMTLASYSAGSFTRTASATYPVASYNGNLHGLSHKQGDPLRSGVDVKFTTPQAMTSAQTLTIVWRFTWDRILTN
jgi:hypothetical protein